MKVRYYGGLEAISEIDEIPSSDEHDPYYYNFLFLILLYCFISSKHSYFSLLFYSLYYILWYERGCSVFSPVPYASSLKKSYSKISTIFDYFDVFTFILWVILLYGS